MNRRQLLASASAAALPLNAAPSKAIPIVDCHIHLFDQTRPQGAPYYAAPGNTQPAYPARYRRIAAPLGIVAAIEVEASPWIEDNLWVLEVEKSDTMMVGTIGNLQPEKPEFKEYLDRYRKNKLFLGIRYGNLWGYSLPAQVSNATFIDGLKLLAEANLTMDSANPTPDLIEAIIRVTDKVPSLRIVVDHLPALLGRLGAAEKPPLEANLRELAKRPQVYFKISEFLQMNNGKPVTEVSVYNSLFDYFLDTFGPDRLVFGSDWPNAESANNLPEIVKITRDYFGAKDSSVAEKFFWKNSKQAYRWAARDGKQP